MGFLLRNAFTQSIVYRNTNKMTPGPESLLVMVSASLTLQISGFCKWSLSFSWHLIEYTFFGEIKTGNRYHVVKSLCHRDLRMVTIAISDSQLLCKMQKCNIQHSGLWRCLSCLSGRFGSHSLSRDLWQPQALSLLLVFLPASQKSEEHLCRHLIHHCLESRSLHKLLYLELPTGICYSFGMRSATPRMREYLNLQSFSECPQHPRPTFIPCDHLMSYYNVLKNYLHDLSTVFPYVNPSYLEES